MTKPYSMDLRERAVAAVEAGQSCRAVAKLFDLGPATVVRWVDRQRTSGACAPKPMGGARHAVLLPERDWLLARIAAMPDATVRTLRAELAERGTNVSKDAVWRFLRNARLTFKKSLRAAEQDRPDVVRKLPVPGLVRLQFDLGQIRPQELVANIDLVCEAMTDDRKLEELQTLRRRWLGDFTREAADPRVPLNGTCEDRTDGKAWMRSEWRDAKNRAAPSEAMDELMDALSVLRLGIQLER